MDLSLTPTQVELRDNAREFVRGAFPDAVLIALQSEPTSYTPESWATLAQTGWFGLLVPEQYGGAELPAMEAAVVFEEFGRGPVPLLVYASAVLGVLTVRALATDEQQKQILPALAEGRMRLTPAITEADYGWEARHVRATLVRDGADYRLDGTKLFVPDAAGASHFLVPARLTGGQVVFAIVEASSPGLEHRRLPGLMDWQSEVIFSGVTVPLASVLGTEPHASWDQFTSALDTAIPIMALYQVGSCQQVFEMSVSYSSARVQFGRPIGQFQRVQDHIIGIANQLDSARWTSYQALANLTHGAPDRASVHLAKAVTAEAHWEVCNAAHEIHAGLGSDTQFGLPKHTYLSRGLYTFLGDPGWHRQELARVLAW